MLTRVLFHMACLDFQTNVDKSISKIFLTNEGCYFLLNSHNRKQYKKNKNVRKPFREMKEEAKLCKKETYEESWFLT